MSIGHSAAECRDDGHLGSPARRIEDAVTGPPLASHARASAHVSQVVNRYERSVESSIARGRVWVYGVRFEENSLERDAWNRIYDETDSEIAHYLQSGTSVVDASRNFRIQERARAERIAAANAADFLLIYVDTPERVPRERLFANRQCPNRIDWGDASFDDIVNAMEPPGEDELPLVYHFRGELEAWLREHSTELSRGRRAQHRGA